MIEEAKAIAVSLKSALSAVEIVEYPGPEVRDAAQSRVHERGAEVATKPLLSKAALRTLSFIAYFQPISSTDLAARRSSAVYEHVKDLEGVGFLVWVRKGRSKLYSTTPEFAEVLRPEHGRGLDEAPARKKNDDTPLTAGLGPLHLPFERKP